jgi:uncharacterized protein YjdB
MKKKSLSVLIALSLAVTTALPAASVFATGTSTVVTAGASTTVAPASTYGVEYEAHVQSIGWQAPVTVTGDQTDVASVAQAGTTGQSKRIEALKITGTNLPAGASIIYQTHVQSIGWQSAVTETGNLPVDSAPEAGTTGQSKRVEALKITLAGLPGYAVKYQAHVQSIGWQAPVTVNNGTDISDATIAGTTGLSKRVEALRIEIVKTDAEKAAEVTAINAVAQAQASKATADITAATTAVQAVLDTTENAALTAQIAAITPASANVTVSSVTATAADAITVKLSGAPADTSKVTFAVTNGGTVITPTITWDSTNTIATLTSASNLPDGTYAVDVKNGSTDLGSNNVTITDQKVASITITSSKLAVQNNIGYATYKVLDQYGVDVTDTALGNELTFQSGIGSVTNKNGQLTVTPSGTNQLVTFSTVVVTGYDTNTGVSTSATLTTSTQVGTLSDIELGTALTNVDNKVLTAGDNTDVFYLPYTATDMSGNPTSDYKTVLNGLINNGNSSYLTTSDPTDVTAQVVQDPNNSNNAVIKVMDTGNTITEDMPVVITAMTWTGKTSSINVTLKKQAQLDSLSLQEPAQEVAANDTSVTIPFTAVDQNGTTLTKFSDINPYVTLSSNATASSDANGNYQITLNGPFTANGTQVVTATTSTGKYSSININVQKNWVADSLSLSSTELVSSMATGATQGIDFGYNDGGLIAYDQYDRKINMTQSPGNYEVVATSSNPTVVGITDTASDASPYAAGGTGLVLTAGATGTSTVTFDLIDKTNPSAIIDSKSQTISVQTTANITGYTIDQLTTPIYAGKYPGYVLDITGQQYANSGTDYDANPVVYGTTASGAKVKLAEGQGTVVAATVDDTSDFSVLSNNPLGNPDGIDVQASAPSNNATTASATLKVSVKGVDGKIYVVSTPVTSSTAAPIASSLGLAVATQDAGVTVDSTGNNVTINTLTANLTNDGLQNNDYITYLKPASDSTPGDLDGKASAAEAVYFQPNDQYGEKDSAMASITQTAATVNGETSSTVFVSSTGQLQNIDPTKTTVISVTGVANGQVKAITLTFAPGGAAAIAYTPTQVNTATTNINAGNETIADFTVAGVTGAVSANLAAYKTAIASAEATKGSALIASEIQTQVNNVNATATQAAPLAAVNDATDVPSVETAIQNTNLGLDLTVYNELSAINKTSVANDILTYLEANNSGYANVAAIQNTINSNAKISAQATIDATAAANKSITASVAALVTPTIDAVAGANLGTLPTTDATNGTTIAWTSSDATVVDNTGAYAGNGNATLTATISKANGTDQTVTFAVTAAGGKITGISKN